MSPWNFFRRKTKSLSRRRHPASWSYWRQVVESLEARTLLSLITVGDAELSIPAYITEYFDAQFNGVIQFEVTAVIYTNHFTQPGGSASEENVQQFTASTRAALDGFVDQLKTASDGMLQASYNLQFSDRVFTQQDYDEFDYGNGNRWLALKPAVIETMKTNDFGGSTPAIAFVMWGSNQTVGTANFYHGNDFISVASPSQGVVSHEFMHLLDDKLQTAGQPGMVHADDLGDTSKYPCITTAETIKPNGELDWEGTALIRNILTYHESCDGTELDLSVLSSSLGNVEEAFQSNGSAQVVSGELQLTDREWQRGSIWFDELVSSDQFSATFDFTITQQGGIGWGDGFTFAAIDALSNGSNALGDWGSGLGYQGLSGFAIEFDTYSGIEGDPPYVHVGVDIGGSVSSVAVSSALPFEITEAGWVTAEITYNGGALNVALSRPGIGKVSILNAVVPEGTLPNSARIGFTGATGAAFQKVSVDNFQLDLNIGNMNDAPTEISLSSTSIQENNVTNAAVGTLSATDPDASSTFAFSLVAGVGSTDNGSFTISGNTLKIIPVTNFETKNSYDIRVRVADQDGLTFEKQFTINVTNTPELVVGGPAVTWAKNQSPIKVLPQLTVGATSNLAGRTLTISVNAIGTAKKLLDQFGIPSFAAFSTGSETHFANGHITRQIQLSDNATVAAIQSFLRGITFATKGKGLKTPTRTLTVTLTDEGGLTSSVTQTIRIQKKSNSVDGVPTAVNDTLIVTQNSGATSGSLADNDISSGDGGNFWSLTTAASNGVAVVNPNGTFTYSPNAGFNGLDSFSYTLTDADGDASTTTVSITVTATDHVPMAMDDSLTVAEDSGITSGNLATNDTPSSDGGNVWSLTTAASNGVAVVNANGIFSYTPNTNFNGSDLFTYRITDSDGDTSTATVAITVTSVDDLPVAVNDTLTVAEDSGATVGSVSGNDTLSGDGGNVWTLATGASNGVAVVNANGIFSYTPNGNFNGPDSFSYTLTDADGDASTTTVAITVTSVDDDTLGPEIQLISPTSALSTAENVTVAGRVTDTLSGVASLQARLDEGTLFSVSINPSGDFSFDTDLAIDGTSDGSHTIRLSATDLAGNISIREATFILETAVVTPTIIIDSTSPSEGIPSILNPGSAYTITGSNFELDTPSSIELVLVQDDATISLGTAQVNLDTDSFSANIIMPAALPGGSLIEARQGNATLAAVQITVLHAADVIQDLFITAFGRNPGSVNLSYWQTRTDKSGPALLGAMESARLEYEASALRMELVGAPTQVREDGTLTARFTNAEPSETVQIHLVYKGTIVQSATAITAADGTGIVSITVPNPLLPITFDGPVSSENIDVLLIHREQASIQTITLKEGPRLLLKSAEANEGDYFYFAVRNVKADAQVKVKLWMHTSGTGYKELYQTLGRTNDSNSLDLSNSKILAPKWLQGESTENGMEIDIWTANDDGSIDEVRGYKAKLKKGGSLADIIAELIRDNGTDSIEAELRVLLSEEERILADQLLGDDWEGNAEAIGDALDQFIGKGGGFGGDIYNPILGASQKVVSTLLSWLGISSDQFGELARLQNAFSEAHRTDHQNALEAMKTPFGSWVKALGVVRQEFLTPVDYISGRTIHGGYDIANTKAPDIPAFIGGRVVSIGGRSTDTTGWGLTIVLEDSLGRKHRYAHLSQIYDEFDQIGAYVSTGQIFCKMGTSGLSTGTHLHYEVTKNGALLDPGRNFAPTLLRTEPVAHADILSVKALGAAFPVSQPYLESDPINPTPDHRHAGIDYAAPQGRTVHSVTGGIVIFAGGVYGTVAVYDGTNTIIYLHMTDIAVVSNQEIVAGTDIGKVGGVSPNKLSPHLHIEVRVGRKTSAVGPPSGGSTSSLTADPLDYLLRPS